MSTDIFFYGIGKSEPYWLKHLKTTRAALAITAMNEMARRAVYMVFTGFGFGLRACWAISAIIKSSNSIFSFTLQLSVFCLQY
jgi:hypothetical protein